MSNLIPVRRGELKPTIGARAIHSPGDWRTTRAVVQVERETTVRQASVRGHEIVQTEKLHAIDRLAREAMTGQALLEQWGASLTQGDPFLADEVKYYANLARSAKGQIIADTVADFSRESR